MWSYGCVYFCVWMCGCVAIYERKALIFCIISCWDSDTSRPPSSRHPFLQSKAIALQPGLSVIINSQWWRTEFKQGRYHIHERNTSIKMTPFKRQTTFAKSSRFNGLTTWHINHNRIGLKRRPRASLKAAADACHRSGCSWVSSVSQALLQEITQSRSTDCGVISKSEALMQEVCAALWS